MTIRKRILFTYIQVIRYVLKRKFITIFGETLKGYIWSTQYNYEYLTGDYEEKETMDTFCSWLREDSVFYDLGANVGYYSFIANQYISKGKIYSFEPMPPNIDTFEAHLRLNAKRLINKSISLMPYAVSDEEKEVVFSSSDMSTEGNTYVNSALHKSSSKNHVVKCYSVDGLLDQGYLKPDILKIDVEGAEFDVLKGAEQTIKKYHPNILLATHDCHLPGVQKLCTDFLLQLGYEMKMLSNENKTMAGLDDYIAMYKSKK